MHQDEFCELVHGVTAATLAEYFAVDARQIRRWKSGASPIPGAVARLARLRYGVGENTGNAAALLGDEWQGFRFGSDGKLYIEGWRGGFDPHAIKAMFFQVQHIRHHEATIRQQERRIAELEQDVIDANAAAVKYRGLVRRDAKFGLMLERITG